jgi:hypothetical protein
MLSIKLWSQSGGAGFLFILIFSLAEKEPPLAACVQSLRGCLKIQKAGTRSWEAP